MTLGRKGSLAEMVFPALQGAMAPTEGRGCPVLLVRRGGVVMWDPEASKGCQVAALVLVRMCRAFGAVVCFCIFYRDHVIRNSWKLRSCWRAGETW